MPDVENISFRERVLGAFVGQAVGDAVGFVLEKSPPGPCRDYAEAWRAAGRPEARSRQAYPFGQVSDDTQFSLHLARSLAASGTFDGEDYARRLTGDFQRHQLVGIGGNSRKAMQAFLDGTPWDRCGVDASSNGAVMRAWVPAAAFADPEALEKVTRDQSSLTHRNDRAQAAAIIVAHAARHVLEGGAMSDMIAAVRDRVTMDPRNFHGLAALDLAASLIALPLDEAARGAAAIAEHRPEDWSLIPPDGLATAVWALWSAINGGGDPLEAIRLGLSCGGDVDSTAAIAGALSGAAGGIEAIPPFYQGLIENQGVRLMPELDGLATVLASVPEESTRLSRPGRS